MKKIGQVIQLDETYIENLISKHGSIREAQFENRPLSEYEHERKVVFEKARNSNWNRDYEDEELFPMYVEKCRNGDRIVFGSTRNYGAEDGQTVYHHYRWPIQDYGRDWRLREIINIQYDYSKAINLFKR